jgi:uncharacterized protein YbcI
MTATEPEHLVGGRLNSALANAVVRLHHRRVGRGPTKSRAFYRENVVVALHEGAMTRAEQSLIDDDRLALALSLRRHYHEMMQDDLVDAVEALTGRRVVAFLSASEIEPDMTGQVFLLDRPVEGEPDHLEAV